MNIELQEDAPTSAIQPITNITRHWILGAISSESAQELEYLSSLGSINRIILPTALRSQIDPYFTNLYIQYKASSDALGLPGGAHCFRIHAWNTLMKEYLLLALDEGHSLTREQLEQFCLICNDHVPFNPPNTNSNCTCFFIGFVCGLIPLCVFIAYVRVVFME